MKIAIACDHRGVDYKNAIIQHLKELGHETLDFGTNSKESCHYPLFAAEAAKAVAAKEADLGIVVCSSGEGVSIVANKIKGIRCGIAYNDDVARLMREHNNANVISFGEDFMDLESVLRRVDIFISTPFSGGKHAVRVDLIKKLEE